MFATASVICFGYLAAMLSSSGLYNILLKTTCTGMALWGTAHSLIFWGFAVPAIQAQ